MSKLIGEIIEFVGGFTPTGTLPCDGRRLKVSEYKSLFAVIGDIYTNGTNVPDTFCIPKYEDKIHFIVVEGLYPVE